MIYYSVLCSDESIAFQEVWAGMVQRYTDAEGNTVELPAGVTQVLQQVYPEWALPDPAPAIEQPLVEAREVTKLDFIDRLGADYLTILAVAKTSVEVEAFVNRFNYADGLISLDDPRLVAGLQAFEAMGMMAPGRAGEVLA